MKWFQTTPVVICLLVFCLTGCQAENGADNGGGNGGPVPQDNPIPTLSSMTPTAIVTHMPGFVLEVTGSDFVDGARVVFNEMQLDTTYLSSTRLRSTVPTAAATLASPGKATLSALQKETVPVRVRNPSPGGGDSASLDFSIHDNFAFAAPVALSTPGRGAYHPKITVSPGGLVDVSWHEVRGSNRDICVRHSPDGGNSWEPIRTVAFHGSSENPTLCRDGDNRLHCVFEYQTKVPYVVLRHITSSDDGATWSAPVSIQPVEAGSIYPLLFRGQKQTLHLVYCSHEIYAVRSLDGGITWGARLQISNSFYRPGKMDACVDAEGRLFVLWQQPQGNDSEDRRLWFSRSTDKGVSWQTPKIIRVFEILNWANHLSLAAGTNQHLTAAWSVYNWTGYGDEFYVETLFANRSGDVWSSPRRMHPEDTMAGSAELCADGAGNSHLFLTDDETHSPAYQLRFHRSTDNGRSWSGPVFVKNVSRKSLDPATANDDAGNVFVVFTDDLNGVNTVYFCRSRIP